MRSPLKALALTLVLALLCVPAAFAKGKPSWAGGGNHDDGHGKPAWAGQGKGHEKKAKHEQKSKHHKGQSADLNAADGLDLGDLNPAWQCFMVESIMDAQDAEAVAGGAEPDELSSFDAKFGTNDNKRNSHGKCVSAAAHGEDVSTGLDEAAQQPCDEAPADDGTSDDGAADDGATGDGTSTDPAGDGTSTDAAGDGTSTEVSGDEPTSDEGSDDQSGDSGDCQSDSSAEQDDQDDQADEAEVDDQGDDSNQEDEDDQGGSEAAAFARALLSFIRL
jgi:hypothetical protein